MQQRTLNPFPRTTQIKVVRRRVLQHDLDMFAAISGNRPGMPLPRAPIPLFRREGAKFNGERLRS